MQVISLRLYLYFLPGFEHKSRVDSSPYNKEEVHQEEQLCELDAKFHSRKVEPEGPLAKEAELCALEGDWSGDDT